LVAFPEFSFFYFSGKDSGEQAAKPAALIGYFD
jgi:hypothetical protein